MPPEETDANKGAGSPPAQNGAKGAGSPPAEEVLAENKRKAEKITQLEAESAKKDARIKELEEKAESDGLTPTEEKEHSKLENEHEWALKEANRLRSEIGTKPWIEVARQEATDAVIQYEVERGNEYLIDRAMELNTKLASKSEIDAAAKDLARKIGPYAQKYLDLRPERRNMLAFRDWQSDEKDRTENSNLKEENKKLKEENLAFREGRGRMVRDDKAKQVDQRFNEADKNGRNSIAVDFLNSVPGVSRP